MTDLLYLMSFKNPPAVGQYSYAPEDLHLTVLDNFAIPNTCFHDYIRTAQRLSRWFPHIPVSMRGFKLFGINKDIPVMTVGGEQLDSLHQSFVELMRAHNGKPRNPQFIGAGYDPHISYLDNETQLWDLNSVSLIEHRSGFGTDVWNHGNWLFSHDAS